MPGKIVSFAAHKTEQLCRPVELRDLFRRHAVVLVGDELAAFYLDPWACALGAANETGAGTTGDPYYLWNKREQYRTNVSYMEWVYAAYESGIRDVVIDMAPSAQPGLDEALRTYRDRCGEEEPEEIYRSLLRSAIAMPMDAVVQMAGSLDMKVHALNAGLTGIATLFRQASGVATARARAPHEAMREFYIKQCLQKDIETLEQLLRRPACSAEIEAMREQMEMRLTENGAAHEAAICAETATANAIGQTLGDRPFLGFFQNERIFSAPDDLDGLVRARYGEEKVARVAMEGETETASPKPPQYLFDYSLKGCVVRMTRRCAQALCK